MKARKTATVLIWASAICWIYWFIKYDMQTTHSFGPLFTTMAISGSLMFIAAILEIIADYVQKCYKQKTKKGSYEN